MSSCTGVRVTFEGARATLTFATEGGLNVLSREVLVRLGNAIESIGAKPEVRFTVVRAEGKVFVAGADIKELSILKAWQAKDFSIFGSRVMDALAGLPSVTVAAIHGATLGGGMELALACDFRLAVKSAKLGLPEVTLGLIPGWSGISRLVKLVGPARAKQLFLSGEPISAEAAFGVGLVDEIVNSAEDLAPRVEAFCRRFQRASPQAVALGKRAVLTSDEPGAFAECFNRPESAEGMKAFMEKRSASWMEGPS